MASIQISPNGGSAVLLMLAGQAERAIEVANAHLRVDPFVLPIARAFLGLAYFSARRYTEAIAALREYISQAPNHMPSRIWLTATYAQMGKTEAARVRGSRTLACC